MAGLYNAFQGYNPATITILSILKLDPQRVTRFRDAWFTDDGKHMVVLTRCGGNNRSEYADGYRYLSEHKLYVADHDDTFDSTYAHFLFRVPENLLVRTVPLCEKMKRLGIGADQNGPKAMIDKLTEHRREAERKDPGLVNECIMLHRALTAQVYNNENETQPVG